MDTWPTHPWVVEGRGRIRLGVGVTARAAAVDWPTRLAFAQAVDSLGFDSLWVPDHPVFLTDCWTALAAYATSTSRVRLGPMVSCVLHRSALMTARLAADVDRLSDGRLVLGLGVGWLEPELRFMGIGLPEPRERLATLTKTVDEVRRYWSGEPVHVEPSGLLGEALLWPPVQQPRVPLLIGGSGEQVMLKRVAQHADMWNLEERMAPSAADARQKINVLRGHCQSIGREDNTLIKSYFLNGVLLAPTPERLEARIAKLPPLFADDRHENMLTPRDFCAKLRPVIEEGITYVIVNLTGYDDRETIELLAGHVLPDLQSLAS